MKSSIIYPSCKHNISAAKKTPVVTPQTYVNVIARGLKLPSKAVVCPITPMVQGLVKQGKWKKYFLSADVYCNEATDFCFITGFGCGGPAATLAVEQAIALGVRKIVFVGLAGSLQEEVIPGDPVLCEESVCADGTSPHYTTKEIVRTDKELTARLMRALKAQKLDFHFGRNWSTDAVFCETKAEIKHYQKNHVLTVDMETSALLAVCARRKVPCACAYVVSDCLGGANWQPDFKNPLIWQNLRRVLTVSQTVLN